MLKGAFSFAFNHRVVCADFGRFNNDHNGSNNRPQIVVATDTNKILLQNAESIFHVAETVTCIAVCPISGTDASKGTQLDAVIIGTRSSLTAFDVFNNRTIFHKDMPEGVKCIKTGLLDTYKEHILVCGCGTTIWGLAIDGSDLFWTALGDDVNALEFCDMDNDGNNELLVGSNSVEIKVFKNATFLSEFDEGDATLALCAFRPATFAFGLSSGVVGVYGNGERYWRVKTKSTIVSLLPFPDPNHVVCIWNNAKIDIRNVDNGEIHCKEQVDGNGDLASALLINANNNYETIGDASENTILTLVYRSGKVHGLSFSKNDIGATDVYRLMREFGQKRHNLIAELKNLELQERAVEDPNAAHSLIPLDTNLECSFCLNAERGLCLRLGVSNDVPIKAVLLFGEGIFDTECYTIHPTGNESSQLSAYFSPTKDIVTELFIKVFAGYSSESQLRVFEINQVLPKFATFLRVSSETKFPLMPKSTVEFNINVRADRLNVWLAEKFLEPELSEISDDNRVPPSERLVPDTDALTIVLKFVCTRNNTPLILELRSSGVNILRHDNIESAANILQSLCAHLNIKSLESRAYFPEALKTVEGMIKTMEEKYSVIEKLSSDWAERLNIVRECVIRAEDSLNIKNITAARKFYVRVAMLNRELVGQHMIRLNSRQELIDALKTLNLRIEQFARLRVGVPASQLIQECRKAIADENMTILPKLLQFGV